MRTVGVVVAVVAVALVGAGCGLPVERTLTVDSPTADAARVVCGAQGTGVEPDSIRPRVDGVHLVVDNPSGAERLLYVEHAEEEIPAGGVEVVTTAPPGELRLACVAPEEPVDPEESPWPYPADDEWVVLRVVDVDGVWVDTRLDCPHPTGTHPDYEWDFTDAPVPPGREGDPVELARTDLRDELGWLGARGRLERAGYLEVMPAQVRLVQRGSVVAVVRYQPDGRGGWHYRGVDYCEDGDGRGEGEPADA